MKLGLKVEFYCNQAFIYFEDEIYCLNHNKWRFCNTMAKFYTNPHTFDTWPSCHWWQMMWRVKLGFIILKHRAKLGNVDTRGKYYNSFAICTIRLDFGFKLWKCQISGMKVMSEISPKVINLEVSYINQKDLTSNVWKLPRNYEKT